MIHKNRNIYIGTISSYIRTFSSDSKMTNLTKKESEIMLHLFRNFTKDYNANSISKELDITPRGALKTLKNLELKELLISKQLGKARFYKLNLKDHYTEKILESLLIAEGREKASRWLYEFKDIFKHTQILIIFGSILRNSEKAKDTDIIFVYKKDKYELIQDFISKKNKILLKPIHEIPQTLEDLKHNIKEANPAIIDAIKTGYVLDGYDKLIQAIKNV